MSHCVRWGSLIPREGRFGVEPPTKTSIAAKPSVLFCHLAANTNEELSRLATAIPPFAKITLVLVRLNKLTLYNHVDSSLRVVLVVYT